MSEAVERIDPHPMARLRAMVTPWLTHPATFHEGFYGAGSAMWAEWAFVQLARGAERDVIAAGVAEAGEDRKVRYRQIDEVFDGGHLPFVTYAYMVRRFGPPSGGFDEYKEMGSWWLTTPDDGVIVNIYPRGGSVGVGVAILKDDERLGDSPTWNPNTIVFEAVLATLVDLMKPVGVRDSCFSPAGKWDHAAIEVYFCWTAEADEDQRDAERLWLKASTFEFAGYGVTTDYWAAIEAKEAAEEAAEEAARRVQAHKRQIGVAGD